MDSTAADIRKRLLDDVERWQGELAGDVPLRGTFELGIALSALRELEPLLRLAIEGLLPEAQIPSKPTLGQLVELIERHGRRQRMDCLRLPRKLLARGEIPRLNRLTQARNAVAHLDASRFDRSALGRLNTADIREVIDAVRAVAELPLFDELLCRSGKGST